MVYDKKDILQGFVGAFSGLIFFMLLRTNMPFLIDPKVGLSIGIVWLLLIYNPFESHPKEATQHFFGNLVITAVIASILSLSFGLITQEQLSSFDFFGTAAFLGILIGLPIASIFDKRNINDPLKRFMTMRK